jgi:hypothetical protein
MGKTMTFGGRLYAYGCRHRLVFGINTQGWHDVRAEIEFESILTSVVQTEAARPGGQRTISAPQANWTLYCR